MKCKNSAGNPSNAVPVNQNPQGDAPELIDSVCSEEPSSHREITWALPRQKRVSSLELAEMNNQRRPGRSPRRKS